jgi:ribosome-associated toxin RatA of RatAB toxin-antitoxin module
MLVGGYLSSYNAGYSMKTVHKSVLIWFSAEEMFALVTDVASYPEFLPWCDKTRIVSQDANGMVAEIGMALGGFHKSFTTRNIHTPGRQVKLTLIDGPFKQLDGTWNFYPLPQDGNFDVLRACRVELTLNYSFESMFGALVGPLFDKIAATLIDAFVQRAEKVYV